MMFWEACLGHLDLDRTPIFAGAPLGCLFGARRSTSWLDYWLPLASRCTQEPHERLEATITSYPSTCHPWWLAFLSPSSSRPTKSLDYLDSRPLMSS